MPAPESLIPASFARLIVRYTHNLLTAAEADALDEWVVASEENMDLFVLLTDGLEDAVFCADELIAETDELVDLWMIAGLMAKELKGMITPEEKERLQEWVGAAPGHEKLYQQLKRECKLHGMVLWIKREWANRRAEGLN